MDVVQILLSAGTHGLPLRKGKEARGRAGCQVAHAAVFLAFDESACVVGADLAGCGTNLLNYCERDTWAIVKLLEKLEELASPL